MLHVLESYIRTVARTKQLDAGDFKYDWGIEGRASIPVGHET